MTIEQSFKYNPSATYSTGSLFSKKSIKKWNSKWLSFWQNQSNFAIWCATTGCGINFNNYLQASGIQISCISSNKKNLI